jgi:hypothetical protein
MRKLRERLFFGFAALGFIVCNGMRANGLEPAQSLPPLVPPCHKDAVAIPLREIDDNANRARASFRCSFCKREYASCFARRFAPELDQRGSNRAWGNVTGNWRHCERVASIAPDGITLDVQYIEPSDAWFVRLNPGTFAALDAIREAQRAAAST